MVSFGGIQVHLKQNGQIIEVTAGKIVVAPGSEFQIFITIHKKFQWRGATRLYVEIASRDPFADTGFEGGLTQVLAIRSDAPNKAHKITEVSNFQARSSTNIPQLTNAHSDQDVGRTLPR
jgi:hypothetical protein